MTNAIAQASIASTNLLNGLQLINRETERVSDNPEIVKRFETCKSLRRQILLYIQHVESDDWIGSLVNANDELVKALTAYEIMDRSIEDDSDSDEFEPASSARGHPISTDTATQLAGIRISDDPPAKPPRPPPATMAMPPVPKFQDGDVDEDDDADNPFGDSNAVSTPQVERSGMTWREV
jgi:LAS seventeen-binding protein 5